MYCTLCGSPLDPAHAFCTTCGTPRVTAAAPTTYCTTCGTPFDAAHYYCTRCGAVRPADAVGGFQFAGAAPLGSAWALRPLGVTERLDAAIKAYVANFRQCVTVLTLIAIPFGILEAIVTYSSGQFTSTSFSPTSTLSNNTLSASTQDTWTRLAGSLSSLIITSVVSTIAITTVALLVGAWYVGSPVGWRDALRRSVRRLPSTLTFLILRLLLVALLVVIVGLPVVLLAANHSVVGAVLVGLFGFIAAFAVFLWIDVSWKATVPSIILEDLRVIPAMRRSWRLIRGSWWSVFGTIALGFLLVEIASGFFTFGVVAVVLFSSRSAVVSVVVLAVISTLELILLTPFTAIVNVIVSIDMRVRKEGLDLELLSTQIDVPATRGAVPSVLTWVSGSGFPSMPSTPDPTTERPSP